MKSKFLIYLGIIIYILISCKKQLVGPVNNTSKDEITPTKSGIYIINEGMFNSGTGSLSFIDYETNAISNNIFFNTNSRPLGDVPLSMQIIDSLAYIIVNNSAKIEIININTLKSVETVLGFVSPRFMQVTNNNKAYISNLYSDSIAVFNLTTNSIQSYIDLGKSSESMCKVRDKVYVLNWSNFGHSEYQNNTVQVIDIVTDAKIKDILVTKEPNSIVVDKNNKIWILCSGGYSNEETPALIRINTATNEIDKTMLFSQSDYPSKLCINNTNDTIYYLNNSVYQMAITENSLPINPIINNTGTIFYGLGINPKNSNIYLSDAIDYSQQGFVYTYSPLGIAIDTFKVGIVPSFFAFN